MCHEAEQVDYEIVLHAEEMRLPITGGAVMSVEEYFADEICWKVLVTNPVL